MAESPQPEIYTPYTDYQSRSLVLQLMKEDSIEEGIRDLKTTLAENRDSLFGRTEESQGGIISDEEAVRFSDEIVKELEGRGTPFLHTEEYYTARHAEQERMKAYKSIKVAKVPPQGVEAEIIENPFRFLNLPDNATFGQTRAAWIRLGKLWFPDLIYPENPEQFERIFGYSRFPVEGVDPKEWFERTKGLEKPEVLSAEKLSKLSPEEQEGYRTRHEAYRAKELEYGKVKEEMRRLALDKMQIINMAYAEARKRFSEVERETLAGFEWDKRYDEIDLGLGAPFIFEHDVLRLEGDGETRRERGRFAINDHPYLTFDFGGVYMDGNDYRQTAYLREFFAWMELKQSKELSPNLLDDMVEFYKLDVDQSEQLRQMIMNGEDPKFMIETLKLGDEKSYILRRFVSGVYDGPTFYHLIGPRSQRVYPVGVEITSDSSLVLRYTSQDDQNGFGWSFPFPATSSFTSKDFEMMLVIAYGPMLQAGTKSDK